MSDEQVDAVRQRLSRLWMHGGVEVYWMLPKDTAAAVVHALGAVGTITMCGVPMNGMFSKRRYVSEDVQCTACLEFLQKNGRLV